MQGKKLLIKGKQQQGNKATHKTNLKNMIIYGALNHATCEIIVLILCSKHIEVLVSVSFMLGILTCKIENSK